MNNYDVIVIGGGHAGCEASHAAATMGLRTLLITTTIHHIALMPCNPAIGGPGKGHVVKEIDALGGLMAKATDQSTLHIRRVNTGKGPAVQTLRAQTQRDQYSLIIRSYLEQNPFLHIFQGEAEEALADDQGKICGVRVRYGTVFPCRAVVVATGTFLNGVIRLGEISFPAGRHGEFPAQFLNGSLQKLGLKAGRLNTCTPPRIDRRTIDYAQLDEQQSDEEPLCFSSQSVPRVYTGSSVFLTRTTEKTCDIIRKNFNRSPLLYAWADTSPVRECPSLEDKIYRFPDHTHHLVFLEPEGIDNNEIYVQGVFTSLPEEVQWEILHSIPGLERCQIIRPGYGIEYDYLFPTQLHASLECRTIPGLFLAGQINGTSGYEEAAAQGILAGINAGRFVQGKPSLILKRDESYLGVMVDDLVTKGVDEPYRLRTGKVEYRLIVRHSNADLRLAGYAREVGIISEQRYQKAMAKQQAIEQEIKRLEKRSVPPTTELNRLLSKKMTPPLSEPVRMATLLARPQLTYYDLAPFDPERPFLPPEAIEEVEIRIRYQGYIDRQLRSIEYFRHLENKTLPPDFDYARTVNLLSSEARERLQEMKPATLGQASRIPGVSPSDIQALAILLEKHIRS
ncbi:MAG: tRNA uridine-5-carboxymethylaminomethyl(34) synthesis enzyme MnmG [Candidatus Atribacteria bacterium]|nr:tRNA uridine-5-carboxymethylaminomethyl(34) synthesis enzyme MnmG [Candidatus Atribacteria bacterium]